MLRLLLCVLLACDGGDAGADDTDDGVQPEDCAADEVYATQCSDCGPSDACIDPVAVCALRCPNDGEACGTGGFCMGEACLQNVCG